MRYRNICQSDNLPPDHYKIVYKESVKGGHVTHSAYWYDVPEGKYLLTVTGFARKEIVDDRAANYGFQFKLTKVEEFKEARNPREEAYEFNIWWIHTSKKAVVQFEG